MLPVPDGAVLGVEANTSGRLSYIQAQPFLVEETLGLSMFSTST